MYCLETKNLVHKFSKNEIVLDHIDLEVVKGSIYGFLGPNGAGKTTTLRLVLGLLKIQQGEISVFGKPFEKNRVEILRNVGSLIESPSLYAHLSAVENLDLLRKVYRFPKGRIQEVLDLVGLPDTGNKNTGQFSLGMKQRLSIAIALLHRPSLLILDEPTNGLDPNGMIEMRELLIDLNQQGITIIISSHLLAEIEKLVTHIGVINKGRMLFQGTFDELKSKQNQSLSIVFETNDIEKTIEVIRNNNLPFVIEEGKLIISASSKSIVAKVIRELVECGIEIYDVSRDKNSLETIFMDLINN